MAGGHPTHFAGDLRQALLDAAVADIDEHGIGALSLRSIARRVGVSHAAPAHHFGDRAGLMTALAVRGAERLRQFLEDAGAAVDDPVERVVAIGRAYLAFARTNPSLFDVMMRPELQNSDDPGLVTAGGAAYQVLVDTIAAARAAGWAPGQDTQALAVLAWASVHGVAVLGRTRQFDRLGAGSDPGETVTAVLAALGRVTPRARARARAGD